MGSTRPLLIAVPAFLLGCIVTAGLTTTARAQGAVPPQPAPRLHWVYKVVGSEVDLNRWGEMGWEYAGQSSAASANSNMQSSFTTYTLRKQEPAFAKPRMIGTP